MEKHINLQGCTIADLQREIDSIVEARKEIMAKLDELEKEVEPIIRVTKLMQERLKKPQTLRDKELYLKEQEKFRKDGLPIQSHVDLFKRG